MQASLYDTLPSLPSPSLPSLSHCGLSLNKNSSLEICWIWGVQHNSPENYCFTGRTTKICSDTSDFIQNLNIEATVNAFWSVVSFGSCCCNVPAWAWAWYVFPETAWCHACPNWGKMQPSGVETGVSRHPMDQVEGPPWNPLEFGSLQTMVLGALNGVTIMLIRRWSLDVSFFLIYCQPLYRHAMPCLPFMPAL